MTLSLEKLNQYARTLGTKVIDSPDAYRIAPGGKSAVFVLESGPKLTMTEEQIAAALAKYAREKAIESAVEEAREHAGETEAERKARLKKEAKAKKDEAK